MEPNCRRRHYVFGLSVRLCVCACRRAAAPYSDQLAVDFWSPIYKISYDLSYDYRKFIVRLTYDRDLKSAKICFRNIVS